MSARNLKEIVERLILSQYSDSPKLHDYIVQSVAILQDIEDSADRIERFADPSLADGGWIDLLGKMKELSREPDERDDDFLARIYARAAIGNAGTPDYIISEASRMSGDPDPSYFEEYPGNVFVLTVGGRQLSTSQTSVLPVAGNACFPAAMMSLPDQFHMASEDGCIMCCVADDATIDAPRHQIDSTLKSATDDDIVTDDGDMVRIVEYPVNCGK